MTHIVRRAEIARYGAAVAFLAAVTIAALLIRSGIKGHDHPSTNATPVHHVAKRKFVPPSKRRYYRVHSGDTLAGIAFQFKTTVGLLNQLNPHLKATSLQIGKRLRVK
jgi:LysM repeat protein